MHACSGMSPRSIECHGVVGELRGDMRKRTCEAQSAEEEHCERRRKLRFEEISELARVDTAAQDPGRGGDEWKLVSRSDRGLSQDVRVPDHRIGRVTVRGGGLRGAKARRELKKKYSRMRQEKIRPSPFLPENYVNMLVGLEVGRLGMSIPLGWDREVDVSAILAVTPPLRAPSRRIEEVQRGWIHAGGYRIQLTGRLHAAGAHCVTGGGVFDGDAHGALSVRRKMKHDLTLRARNEDQDTTPRLRDSGCTVSTGEGVKLEGLGLRPRETRHAASLMYEYIAGNPVAAVEYGITSKSGRKRRGRADGGARDRSPPNVNGAPPPWAGNGVGTNRGEPLAGARGGVGRDTGRLMHVSPLLATVFENAIEEEEDKGW
ncbi:hypothetical protein FB451DRAFT_1433408 [Mycena latifolia]|nr:hypothetical protein FB451DRAFT_1433408 [Mycena latifolia]